MAPADAALTVRRKRVKREGRPGDPDGPDGYRVPRRVWNGRTGPCVAPAVARYVMVMVSSGTVVSSPGGLGPVPRKDRPDSPTGYARASPGHKVCHESDAQLGRHHARSGALLAT